jgi:hypothetical protein
MVNQNHSCGSSGGDYGCCEDDYGGGGGDYKHREGSYGGGDNDYGGDGYGMSRWIFL